MNKSKNGFADTADSHIAFRLRSGNSCQHLLRKFKQSEASRRGHSRNTKPVAFIIKD